MKKIIILASGSGSNAENIVKYFNIYNDAEVSLIMSNNENAYVLERAKLLGIKSSHFTKADFSNSNVVLNILKQENPDLIVLAGFLWLIPENIVNAFQDKIINIHPALLPKYGGKGMYGDNVHKAVVENNEKESGITIHYVNKKYDEGNIIFQASCEVLPNDTFEDVAEKVHKLEYEHFPKVIHQLLTK